MTKPCPLCGQRPSGRPRKLLTDKQIKAIRADKRKHIAIALAYGISDSYVGKIKRAGR